MDFTLDDDQRMLVDTVARFVETEYEFEKRRKRLGVAPGFSSELWDALAGMGLFGLNVPADHGGFDKGPVETLLVMQQLGRGLVLEPFATTGVLAPRLLVRHGSAAQRERFLPRIAAGELRFSLAALEAQSRYDLHDVATTAQRDGGDYVLDGRKAVALHADSADWLVVSARSSGSQRDMEGVSVFLVEARSPGITLTGFPTIDHQRSAEIALQAVRVPATQLIGSEGQGLPVLDWGVDQLLAALSAEAVGVMERLTELSCDYLRTRSQFGKPIGSFQALQHRAADMQIAVEQARALALAAAAHADSADPVERRRAASAAKAMAGRSGRFVGQQATQLHGGMGMTDEMACGHYFKRLTAIDMTLGNAAHHLERYGDCL
jgi:alkylation response protein AidB-like acyl-CoA dehydrogenase